MKKSHFRETAERCIENGIRLLDDVDWLYYEERPAATCLALATIAQEEFAKAFFLTLVDRGIIAWNSLVNRATRDHTCKQLLGLVLSHLSPDDDEESKRSDEFLAGIEEHKRLMDAYKNSSDKNERDGIWARITEISKSWDALPQSVSDAISILRHEKIGRWKSSFWEWDDEPTYDPLAKWYAEGKLDRIKQDALYVRLGRDGRVAMTPTQITHEDAKEAMAVADRMRFFVKYVVSTDKIVDREYEKIESAIKSAFVTLDADDAQQSPTVNP
jgi:AbiV family abortive infection protein